MENNQPYAFPQSKDNNSMDEDYNGMTLRDYFAAKAMYQIMQSSTLPFTRISCATVAENAYQMADAMLKERNKI